MSDTPTSGTFVSFVCVCWQFQCEEMPIAEYIEVKSQVCFFRSCLNVVETTGQLGRISKIFGMVKYIKDNFIWDFLVKVQNKQMFLYVNLSWHE